MQTESERVRCDPTSPVPRRALDGFEVAAIGMNLARIGGRYERVNPAFCALVGHDAATLLAMTPADLTHPDDVAPSERLIAEALDRGDATLTFDKRFVHADGRALHVRVATTFLRAADGTPEYFFTQVQDVTALVEARRAARAAALRLERVIASAADAFVEVDVEGFVRAWNPAAQAMLGWSHEEAVGRDVIALLGRPDDGGAAHRRLFREFRDQPRRLADTVEASVRSRDGRLVPVEMTAWTIDEHDRTLHVFLHDITDRRAQEAALRRSTTALAESEQRWRLALDNAPTGIALVDPDGRLVRVNAALCVILGYPEAELLGTTFQALTVPEDRATSMQMLERLNAGELTRFTMEKRYRHADGKAIWVNLSVAMVHDDAGRPLHMVTHIEDITDRRARDEALQDLVLRDELTKLANRTRFLEELGAACLLSRPGHPVGVLFCDLDGFKEVNDTYGHAAGDRVLHLVGQRLEHAVRTRDLAARLGGDEFGVLLPPAAHPEDVDAVAARILAVLSTPYDVDGTRVQLGVSIGGVVADEPDSAAALLDAADTAMYEAKRRGKNTSVIV